MAKSSWASAVKHGFTVLGLVIALIVLVDCNTGRVINALFCQ